MAIVAVVVAGVFVAHAASALSSVVTDNLSGTAVAGSGNSTAGHTCPNMTNTTASPTATASRGLWP